jgi:hypothetical protein
MSTYDQYANVIMGKAEKAAQVMLQAAVTAGSIDTLATTAIHSGISASERELPCVVCECSNATSEEPWDGNWAATLRVHVLANAEDTDQDAFLNIAGQVWHRFFLAKDDVATNLSNATVQFTAFMVIPRNQEKDLDREEMQWQATLTLEVKCCGSVVG